MRWAKLTLCFPHSLASRVVSWCRPPVGPVRDLTDFPALCSGPDCTSFPSPLLDALPLEKYCHMCVCLSLLAASHWHKKAEQNSRAQTEIDRCSANIWTLYVPVMFFLDEPLTVRYMVRDFVSSQSRPTYSCPPSRRFSFLCFVCRLVTTKENQTLDFYPLITLNIVHVIGLGNFFEAGLIVDVGVWAVLQEASSLKDSKVSTLFIRNRTWFSTQKHNEVHIIWGHLIVAVFLFSVYAFIAAVRWNVWLSFFQCHVISWCLISSSRGYHF